MRKSLVVSLHDVSPRRFDASRRIVKELHELGLQACSLLVIPNHHHQGHFANDPEFCDWLRLQKDAGCEVVAHGYFHARPARDGEGILSRLTTSVYTAGEGEFYDIDFSAADTLLRKMRAEFAAAGFEPRGFIAPAWLLSAGAEAALRGQQWEYTTRLATVTDFLCNRVFRSQSLVWSVRTAWRSRCSIVWNASLFRWLARNSLLRVSIHPVDCDHPGVWRQIRALLTAALEEREPLTYHAWIERQRRSPRR